MFHSVLFRPKTHTQVRKIKVRILPTQVRTYGPQLLVRSLPVRILLVPILYVVTYKMRKPLRILFRTLYVARFRTLGTHAECNLPLESGGGSCRDAGQQGANPGHPGNPDG